MRCNVHADTRNGFRSNLKIWRPPAGQPVRRHDDTGVAIMIQGILQHTRLQPAVGSFPFFLAQVAAVEQHDLDAPVFHAIPQLAHLLRYGTGGNRLSQGTVGLGELQHAVKMHAQQLAGAGSSFSFIGETLHFVENIGIVPVYKCDLPSCAILRSWVNIACVASRCRLGLVPRLPSFQVALGHVARCRSMAVMESRHPAAEGPSACGAER